jgi:thioredoxin 1
MATERATETGTAPRNEPLYIDGENHLDDIVAGRDVVLTEFYADWCGPCQMLEPILETLAAETRAIVTKVDVDVNQELAQAYGVRGVPTLVLFVDGEKVDQVVGLKGEQELRGLIDSYTE